MLGATNTLIQMLSPDDVRGRALSVYTMIAIGVVPLGSLVDGAIAAAIGLRADVRARRRDLHVDVSRDLVLRAQPCERYKKSESRYRDSLILRRLYRRS